MLSDQEIDELLRSENRDALIQEKELQSQIDESLRRCYEFTPLSESQMTSLSTGSREQVAPSKRVHGTNRKTFIQMAIAASLLIVSGIAVWQFSQSNKIDGPVFQPQALVKIYSKSIARGFSPYYHCDDQQRFADVFENRLGIPLRLAVLPADRKMLGISYLGGLSRHTTAMLCEIKSQPVIVFVDSLENDKPEMAQAVGTLFVFRQQKFGLVFYEVTPFPSAQMIEFMTRIE